MDNTRRLMRAALESDERFRETLVEVIDELGMTMKDLARRAGVSPSTLYKIVNEDRAPSLEVLRKIVRATGDDGGEGKGNFIAIIAARHVLDEVSDRSVRIGDESVRVRDYPASTVEDAIVAAIRAEREGAVAVVCAPIVSPTIEKVLEIPIALIDPRDSMLDAVKLAARKSKT
ncbi:MAG: helix-turn-helix domain-containing protein [Candidatus Thermoplasmatota archaeon]|nr:helix-turn-helix domain-containing protein [Candidatus Thermoplasmatota archaeon]